MSRKLKTTNQSKVSVLSVEDKISSEIHKTAAKYFKEAAKYHQLAAKYTSAGNKAKACESAVIAQGHHYLGKDAQVQAALFHLLNDQVEK